MPWSLVLVSMWENGPRKNDLGGSWSMLITPAKLMPARILPTHFQNMLETKLLRSDWSPQYSQWPFPQCSTSTLRFHLNVHHTPKLCPVFPKQNSSSPYPLVFPFNILPLLSIASKTWRQKKAKNALRREFASGLPIPLHRLSARA